MKRILIIMALVAAAVPAGQQKASAWGGVGHKVTIAVAQRHISAKTAENIAKYIDYDLKTDAVWMDTHRTDKPIAYTTAWHVYNVDSRHEYNPDPRAAKGDCLHALEIVDYNLKHYKELSDSAVVMNIRMLIHFVGDLHCPTHSYFPGPRCFWQCTLDEGDVHFSGKFHGLYDKAPGLYYPDARPDDVAAQLDKCSRREIRKIQKGSLRDWVRSIADGNAFIYEVNPFLTENLAPDTLERTKDLVDRQMRDGGYRLAYLLDLYFGN